MTSAMERHPAPDISIVIPSYNVAPYIAATLESALAQDRDGIEIIVVDDGSADRTVATARDFVARGVILIEQANRGAAAARNRGLAEARGRRILFLDADDLIPPGHLSALTAALGDRDDLVAFGQWDRFIDDPADATFPPRPGYRDADPVDWLVEDWQTGQPMTQCGTYLIPRALLDRLGGWDEELSLIDDFEFFARILGSSAGVRYAAAARLFYRSGLGSSLSGHKGDRAARSALTSLLRGTGHLLAREDSVRTRRAAADMLQAFDYDTFPDHPALRGAARRRVAELGGSDLEPDGPPRFHALRKWIGWRPARRVQRASERLRAGPLPSKVPS